MALTLAEVTANRQADYWMNRLSIDEPLSDVEQKSLDLWLETPQGKAWSQG